VVVKEGKAEFFVLFEKTACGLLTRLMQGRMENTSVALSSSEMRVVGECLEAGWVARGVERGSEAFDGRYMMRINCS
jgi:hypothetical protein